MRSRCQRWAEFMIAGVFRNCGCSNSSEARVQLISAVDFGYRLVTADTNEFKLTRHAINKHYMRYMLMPNVNSEHLKSQYERGSYGWWAHRLRKSRQVVNRRCGKQRPLLIQFSGFWYRLRSLGMTTTTGALRGWRCCCILSPVLIQLRSLNGGDFSARFESVRFWVLNFIRT